MQGSQVVAISWVQGALLPDTASQVVTVWEPVTRKPRRK